MKKLYALLLAAGMSCTMAMGIPAFAEEAGTEASPAATVEINWEDLEAAALETAPESSWYTFDEIAVQMWVPDVLINLELTEEDVEAGYIGYFQTEDETAAIGIQYVDVDTMTLEEYAEALPDLGATEIESAQINGLPCITYDLEEADTMVIAFTTEMGYIFEVSFAPKSDEGFAAVAALVAGSIQPYEEGAEEALETEIG